LEKLEKEGKDIHSPEYEQLRSLAHVGNHITPMCCLPNWDLEDGTFFRHTKLGILQYVPVTLAMAIATFVTSLTDNYGPGHFSPTVAYPWIAFITNASQIWAMYCLVMFYHTLHGHFEKIRPLWKFLSVKLVVFMTFWQSVFIALLIEVSIVQSTASYSTEQISGGIQDFLICFEMFVAACLHIAVWRWDELSRRSGTNAKLARLGSVLSPKDLALDVHSSMIIPVHESVKHAAAAGHTAKNNWKRKHTNVLSTFCCCVDCSYEEMSSQTTSPASSVSSVREIKRDSVQTEILSSSSVQMGEISSAAIPDSPGLQKQDSAESTVSQSA